MFYDCSIYPTSTSWLYDIYMSVQLWVYRTLFFFVFFKFKINLNLKFNLKLFILNIYILCPLYIYIANYANVCVSIHQIYMDKARLKTVRRNFKIKIK